MVRYAGVSNFSFGLKRTAFTATKSFFGFPLVGGFTRRLCPKPPSISAVIVTVRSSAPAGITSVWGPTLRLPPSGPITRATAAEGRFEQARSEEHTSELQSQFHLV